MRNLSILALLVTCAAARADMADDLSDFVGYTIVDIKTIDSFRDRGKEKTDGFEGCDHDRTIIFADGTAVVCRTYSYSYSYRPRAVLLGRVTTFAGRQLTEIKMIVRDRVYDVSAP